MRGARLAPPAFAATFLIGALLTACGGGETGAQTSTGATSSSAATSGDGQTRSGAEQRGTGGGGASPKPVKAEEILRNIETGPLRVSGGGSSSFRYRGDENIVQDFGSEGGRPQLEEAAAAVHGFFVARAQRDWATACSYLSEGMLVELRTLATHYKNLEGRPCPETLPTFAGKVPVDRVYRESEVDAGSLRVRDVHGFLLFRAGGRAYRTSVEWEAGTWKVSSTFATPVAPAAIPPN